MKASTYRLADVPTTRKARGPDAVFPPVSQRRGYFSHQIDREIWIAEARTRLLIRDSKGEKLALDRAFAATMAMLAIENGAKQ